jgi:FtsP/CotA-like multicopper oxidase with cupredoxin domain
MNGFVSTAKGNVRCWYFTDGTSMMGGSGFMGDRLLPSAHFEAIEGKKITVSFFNQSMMDHTIHLHGLDVDQRNDGVPSTSFSVPRMGRATYTFIAPHAGTYHYHCHVDTVLHYEMGMVGAVIVRPPNGSIKQAWTNGPSFDEEVLWHLHTMDTSWHNQTTSGPRTVRHRPDVFLLNGKEASGAMQDLYSRIVLPQGKTAYLRLLNCGYQWARVSLGGLGFQVVASDGRPMRNFQSAKAWELGPGERYDLVFQGKVKGTTLAKVEYLDDFTGKVLGEVKTQVVVR